MTDSPDRLMVAAGTMPRSNAMRLVFLFAITLTACGPFVENTDKPSALRLEGHAGLSADFGVKTATINPASGTPVQGISCKNLLWDAEPSADSAISVMKRKAAEAGFNTVFVASVAPDGSALIKNCWSAIVANGIAFNS